jgi:hypothetical protein
MKGALGLQVIERTIRLYVLILLSTGLYVMQEFAKIKVSGYLDDLTKLVRDIPHVLLVLDIFNRICVPSADPPMPTQHRPTITIAALNCVLSSSQDHKLLCSLKHHYN